MSTAFLYVALFAGAALVAAVAARVARIPYTVGLVICGLVGGILGHPAALAFNPALVLTVFLPALLFAGAWEMELAELRRCWLPITLLATVGVTIGIGVAWALLTFGAHMDGAVALMFGALVAATDPVAVIALFRELGVHRTLATIVEGESLFNDGVAVVAFRTLVLGAAVGATGAAAGPMVESFLILTLGGALVGLAIGTVAALLLRAEKAVPVDVLLTAAAAYGSYLIAERLHASGIVAVIAAGLSCSVVRVQGISEGPARLRIAEEATQAVDRFWERAAFAANSVLFVFVGAAIDLKLLISVWPAAAWGVVAVLAARVATVYGLLPLSAAAGRPIPRPWQHVIALGGMRGALSMALVQSLPENFQARTQLIAMVYSVVLFTLVVQGLSLRPASTALLQARRDHST